MNPSCMQMSLFKKAIIIPVSIFLMLLLVIDTKANQQTTILEQVDVDSAQWYYNQAYHEYDLNKLIASTISFEKAVVFELEKAKPDYNLICDSYGNAGYNYFLLNQYPEGIRVGKLGLQCAIEHNIPEQISTNNANLGCCYSTLDNYEMALFHFTEALKVDIALNDAHGMANSYNNLGRVYESWHKLDLSKEYYQKALATSESLNDELVLGIRFSNLAMLYHKMGASDSAVFLMNKALLADQKMENQNRIATRYSNLGLIYLETGQLNLAGEYFDKALSIFEKTQNQRSLAITYNHLGKMALSKGELTNAASWFNRSLVLCDLLGLKEIAMRNYLLLSELYENEKQFDKALYHFKKYTVLNDSVFSAKSLLQLQELQVQYETEKQNSKILVLKQENELSLLNLRKKKIQVLFSIAGFLIILLAAVLLYRFLMLKTKAHKQQLAINHTKDRFFAIISHDLKNPVSAFNNLTLALKTKLHLMSPEQIKYYVDQLALSADNLNHFLMELLQWSISQKGETRLDISTFNVCKLIAGEINRFQEALGNNNLSVDCKVGESCEVSNDNNIVQTIFRNLLANAIKFSPQGEQIAVKAEPIDNGVRVSVSDSGPGIAPGDIKSLFIIKGAAKGKVLAQSKGTGMGLIICKELVALVGGTIWAENNPDKGTTFFFTIPNQTLS